MGIENTTPPESGSGLPEGGSSGQWLQNTGNPDNPGQWSNIAVSDVSGAVHSDSMNGYSNTGSDPIQFNSGGYFIPAVATTDNVVLQLSNASDSDYAGTFGIIAKSISGGHYVRLQPNGTNIFVNGVAISTFDMFQSGEIAIFKCDGTDWHLTSHYVPTVTKPEYAIIGDFVWTSANDTQVVINEAGSGRYFNLPTDHQTLHGTVSGAPSWLTKANVSSPVVIHGPGTFMVEAWPQNSLAGVSTDDARFSIGQAVLNMPGVGVLMKQTAGALEQYMSVKLGPVVLATGESIAPALFFEITNGTGDLGTGDLTPWIVITKLS